MDRKLFLPILLGTVRQGRESERVAKLLLARASARPEIETRLFDPRDLHFNPEDEGQELKHQNPEWRDAIVRADGLIIVAPEYNHGYPGLLKHLLDSCLKEYIHKAVGIVGVSAGPFGGSRVIQNLLPVMRELGLVTIFWDVNVSNVHKVFDEQGKLLDDAFIRRIDKFLKELIWMAKTLRYGRDNIQLS